MVKKELEIQESDQLVQSQAKKREVKFQEKEEVPQQKSPRRYYHCFLHKKGSGCSCKGERFGSDNIWRHLRQKMHFGPDYQNDAGLPPEVKECLG